MSPRSPAFVMLCTVSLIASAGNMALQAVLPAIGRQFHLPDTLVVGVFAISALMWTVTSPVWARLSDRLGRKRVILIGMAGFSASMTGFGLAATAGLEHWLGPVMAFILMAVGRTIYGVFGSAAPIASQAYVADRTAPAERTQAMSLLASAQGLGTVVGPTLAPLLILPVVGLAGPMYVFALIAALAFFWVLRKLPSGGVVRLPSPIERPDPAPLGHEGRGLWKDARVRDFLIYGLLVTGAQAINISVLGFHIIDEMAKTGLTTIQAQPFIAVAMFAGAAATLMVQWGLIPLLRLEPRVLMRWGAGLALLGNLLSIFAPGFYGVVVGYAVMSMGVGFARPGFTAGASLAVGSSEQGAVAGLMMSISGVSFLFPSVIGVALYQLTGFAPFAANAILTALAFLVCLTSAALRTAAVSTGVGAEAASEPPASQPGPEGAR